MSKTEPSIFKENPLHEVGEDLGRFIMKLSIITFFDKPVTYDVFFKKNRLFEFSYEDGNPGIYIITLHRPKRKMRQKDFSFKSVWLSTCK
jgi:hypothetical protein